MKRLKDNRFVRAGNNTTIISFLIITVAIAVRFEEKWQSLSH